MAISERTMRRFEYEGDFSLNIDPNSKKGRSKTAQSFAKESNINTIIAKYKKTGILVDPITATERTPNYGDFSSSGDYFDMQSKLAMVKSDFEKMPSAIRIKFHHNVGEMLDFVANPANLVEAVNLGLLPREKLPDNMKPKFEDKEGKPVDKDGKPLPPPANPPGV